MIPAVQDFIEETRRYYTIAEKALDQVSDEALNRVLAPNGNSVAMLVRHVSGNLISRFTDFLTTDGEKPWRDRDLEFQTREYSRQETRELWEKGWQTLENALASLTQDDLEKTVTIRGSALTVRAALLRSLAHIAYHAGQIVLLARILAYDEWKWISIPKGMSEKRNENPIREKSPITR
ncbi:MAG: DUF1572 family protein [Acidobacteria bacterium]|nr:DUF1572 family protein [Acidobacteriota bacterium]